MKKILIATTVLATALTATTFAQAGQKKPSKPTARQAYAQVIEPALPAYSGYCEYRTYWGDCAYGGYYYAYGLYPFGIWTGPWYWNSPNPKPRYDYSMGDYN